MKDRMRLFFYILLALLMVADLYLIFNAGNPNSLIRPLVPDAGWDILITFIVSLFIMAIATLVFAPRKKENDNLFILLEANIGHIEKLRSQNQSNEEIADSFLKELKVKGLSYRIARKRVLKYLGEM